MISGCCRAGICGFWDSFNQSRTGRSRLSIVHTWKIDRQECLSYLTMKFSYNWLREYVEGLDTPPIRLEALITMKTAECEGIEKVGLFLSDACTARVDSVEPITGSHNVKARVDTGRYGERTRCGWHHRGREPGGRAHCGLRTR
jgi:hypothetical protein